MTIEQLIERVEKADGPDRELDAAILMALMPGCMIGFYVVGDDEPTVFHAEPLVRNKSELPHYTASIDAAVALIERKLPGFGFEVLAADRDSYRAAVWPWISSRGTRAQIGHQHSYAKTPALALIAALLSALETHNG